MKKKITEIVLLLTTFLPVSLWAQCPSVMSASAATTAASCPSSGSVTITTSPAANSSFTYSITSGPSGVLLNTPQNSNIFNALQPGNYTVQVSCGATLTDVSFTIQDNYTPIANVNAVASANCGSYAPGGTVNISVTGGSAPFVYSIIKSNDPNYADASSVYSSSPNKTVTSYGTYQVRVKDACNQFYTKPVVVNSPLLPMQFTVAYVNLENCNSPVIRVGFDLFNPDLGSYGLHEDYEANGGFKLKIWGKDAGGTCLPTGPVLLDTTITSGNQLYIPFIASGQYYIQTITACGDTTAYCANLSSFYTPYFGLTNITAGCAGSSTNPPVMRIPDLSFAFMAYPITVTAKNSAGITVYTDTILFNGDPYSLPDFPLDDYTFTATDACSNAESIFVTNSASAGAPGLGFYYNSNLCAGGSAGTTQNGTTTGVVEVAGYLEDQENAVLTIISGPSNVGIQGLPYYSKWVWTNLLPGTYVIRVTTTCGTNDFTVVANPDPSDLFIQTITATASSNCGGSGSVNATVVTNYNAQKFYELIDVLTGQAVASNLNGNFGNVSAGTYYIKMATGDCTGTVYYINSNTVTLASGSGPTVAKKMGVICEDINGNPLSTGTAYLSVAGAAPFIVEYKLISSSTWINYSSNASAEIAIPGLTAGGIYDVRITSCGITTATQLSIGQLGEINITTTQQPCAGNPYELDLPQLAGASYEWKNEAGNIVSTSYNYSIASYNASYNGVYTGTTFFGNCAQRTDTVTLNSTLCGSLIILPAKLLSFTARPENCATKLNWKITDASSLRGIDVERSTNSRDYTMLAKTTPDATGSYTDESIFEGVIYYRLKMTTVDGPYSYSKPILVKTSCNSANTQWVRYPALIKSGDAVSIKLNTSNSIATKMRIVVTSITGQRVHTQEVPAHRGQNIYTLQGLTLTPGTYLVCVYDSYLLRIDSAQKLIVTK